MKKIALIAYSSHVMSRLKLVKEVLNHGDVEIKIFCGDFDHAKKAYDASDVDVHYIHVKSYTKNMSVSRLLSHRNFAKDVFKELKNFKPNYIYAQIPSNSLVKQCAKYKKQSGCELVFDLIDMWPESLPIKGAKRLIAGGFLRYWQNLRSKNVKFADLLITECDLYQKILTQQKVKLPPMQTVYLAKEPHEVLPPVHLPEDKINICYLGAINNIIDIPKIVDLLHAVNQKKKVCVHIIGEGESRGHFITELTNAGLEVVYHGIIYDEAKKLEIFSQCHFGLNIMKEYLMVGLTIKSIDYFAAGLPILNNIKEDTFNLVKDHQAGLNLVDFENMQECAKAITGLNAQAYLDMRTNVLKMFNAHFAKFVVTEKFKGQLATLGE